MGGYEPHSGSAQEFFNTGHPHGRVGQILSLLPETLHFSTKNGHLHKTLNTPPSSPATPLLIKERLDEVFRRLTKTTVPKIDAIQKERRTQTLFTHPPIHPITHSPTTPLRLPNRRKVFIPQWTWCPVLDVAPLG